ncbi:DUF1345 domain-containing protein [Rhizorhabdus wittichii]|jgi:uncharacterized membrane protein|uniref:DUF1345 domain-containing protein n=2 Tax=Rhizorhabdus wittichii TaxID=160791 RepID=A0A9J9HBP3_RHIWR|nr:DUF1345 domain-containing protein [Rhizorhabdus wittichii]ABQ68482.1 protein of unknown function DUF1345 [Rhizorhabdus wittichii RW1]ARR54628.1 hypothetical protein HY78_14900 [Rhizorhabdus wittichii DC-6]QTH21054.1 DUF1345 domain-containing protein [Rhizorhabdus wittichii]
MAAPLALGHRLAPPRFLAFMALGIIGFLVAFRSMGWTRAAMIGFDIGAVVFLLSCLPLLGRAPDAMRESAERNDANRVTLLAITGTVCSVILVAIAEELSARSTASPSIVGLIIGTLLVAWLFSNMIYALHYAHLFYSRGEHGKDAGGLGFPSEDEPDYWDFIYFAFTLGMTFQTSDVEIGGRAIRRVVILHCFAAFVFNIGVLAFTINVLGGG